MLKDDFSVPVEHDFNLSIHYTATPLAAVINNTGKNTRIKK